MSSITGKANVLTDALNRRSQINLILGQSLPYPEFSYNNSYQASLKMSPFVALYGRKCRTPLYWNQTGENQVFGQEIMQQAERQVQMIHNRGRKVMLIHGDGM